MKGPTAIQRARQRPLIGYLAHGSANIEFEANDNDATSRGGKNSWSSSSQREPVRNNDYSEGEQGLSLYNRGDNTDAFNVRTELPLLLQQSYSRGQIGVDYLDQVDFSGQRRRPVTTTGSSSSLILLQQQEEGGVVMDRAGTASSLHHGGPRSLPAFRGVLKQAAEAQASYIALEALLHAVEEGGGGGGGVASDLSYQSLPFSPLTRGHHHVEATYSASSSSSSTAAASNNKNNNNASGSGMSTLIGKVARAAYA